MGKILALAVLGVLLGLPLGGCAVVEVGAAAVDVGATAATTAVSVTGDVASGVVHTVAGSSDDKDKDGDKD